ncbi:MAG: glycerol dehydrogenase [Methylobacteriaceae bacterium]|nr:glycerol dehydrogenase [Methylobacteriaceae bacterium]
MSLYIIGFPGKYIQGAGALEKLYEIIKNKKAVMVADDLVWDLVGRTITEKAAGVGAEVFRTKFQGETTQKELDALLAICKEHEISYIIGIGGGKALDTARAGMHFTGIPLIIIPTVASTDAPVSSLTGLYSEQHEHLCTIRTGRNPNFVIVDTSIIINAPKMSFVYGMGDALSTYFEAEAVRLSGKENGHGGRALRMGTALCKLCLDTVLEYGRDAVKALEKKEITPAFEAVLEANILLSGVGFESGGLALAHGLHAAMTGDPGFAPAPHGAKVAFCTMVQLILETMNGQDRRGYIKTLAAFYEDVGLPYCAADFGPTGSDDDLRERYRRMAEKALNNPNNHIHKMPFPMTVDMLVDAMMKTSEVKKHGEYQG